MNVISEMKDRLDRMVEIGAIRGYEILTDHDGAVTGVNIEATQPIECLSLKEPLYPGGKLLGCDGRI